MSAHDKREHLTSKRISLCQTLKRNQQKLHSTIAYLKADYEHETNCQSTLTLFDNISTHIDYDEHQHHCFAS